MRNKIKLDFLRFLSCFKQVAVIFLLIVCFIHSPVFSQESITITTYYPSPHGVYNQLVTQTLGVGNNDGIGGLDSDDAPNPAVNLGDVWISGNVGIGIGARHPDARLEVDGRIWQTGTGFSVFLGKNAGDRDDLTNNRNVFVGFDTGRNNTTGFHNAATGSMSLRANTSGYYNTANGYASLYSNTSGRYNTANGWESLYSNTSGRYDTATGGRSLYANTSGQYNTANGFESLYRNTAGYYNTAIGARSLRANTRGYYNTATGYRSLNSNTTAYYNTATGYNSLYRNSTGHRNTAIGARSLYSNTTGRYNTALGYYAFNSGAGWFNSTAIGYNTQISANNQVRIGNSNVTSIGGYVDFAPISDGRFKKDVKENVPGLEFIMKLRPVTFHWDMKKLDDFLKVPEDLRLEEASKQKEKILQTGLVAQEVEKAAQEIGYDFSGIVKPENESSHYNLGYASLTMPLIKAVQELKAENENLQERVETLERLVQSKKEK